MDSIPIDLPDSGTAAPARIRPSHQDRLTIAVINNMPDSALRGTERQFCRLLDAASPGMLVQLKFYSPPQLPRGLMARAHIALYYEDFATLEQNPPDGIIVTGAEPTARYLEDDPIWAPISRLVEWAVDCSIPGIWSCLASHVAVRYLDGIERHALPRKLSGVFNCGIQRRSYQVTHGLPASWRIPHSRMNGLLERELLTHGYAILSKSSEVGVDMFCRKQGALQLFFQGHPEYEPDALPAEYRRDFRRYLTGTRDVLPQVPRNCLPADKAAALSRLATQATRMRDPDLLSQVDAVLADLAPEHHWFTPASQIYMNWLLYLASQRARHGWQMPAPNNLDFVNAEVSPLRSA